MNSKGSEMFNPRLLTKNEFSNKILTLESHLNKLAVERQGFFNLKFDLENQLMEKDEMIGEKEMQISMMKAQICILLKEVNDEKKKHQPEVSLNSITPMNIVKKIRGGLHNSTQKPGGAPTEEYNDTAASELASGRLEIQPYVSGGAFITTENSIFTHRSSTSNL